MRADTPRFKRLSRIIGGVIVLLLGLDTLTWFLVCRQIEAGVGEAIDQAELDGWRIAAGPTRWSGWPQTAEVTFSPVSAEAGPLAFPPGFVWTADTVGVRLGWLRPKTLVIDAVGRQSVTAPGLPLVPVASRRIEVEVDLAGRTPPLAQGDGLIFSLPGGPVGVETITVRWPSDLVEIAASGVSLPEAPGQVLGPVIEHAQATLRVAPPFPLAATPAQSASQWRDASGRIELTAAALRWGDLAATGQGSGGLDASLQPEAEIGVAAAGLPALIDRLVAAGMLGPQPAVAAKAVITILAAPAHGGPVNLPVSLHAGLLRIAGIALLRVPKLAWE